MTMKRIMTMALAVAALASGAQAETVQIDRAACRALVVHTPLPDSAYQPGVDVRGQPVAPADVSTPLDFPDTVTVAITPEIGKWLPNLNYPYDKIGDSKINLGKIELMGDRVTFNGRALTDPAQENLAVLCLEHVK